MKLKITIRGLIYIILLINPLLSLILDGTEIHFFYIEGPVLALLLILNSLKSEINFYRTICATVITIFCVLFAYIEGSSIGKINNHLFNFLDMILLIFFSINKVEIDYFKNFMKRNILIFLVVISITNIAELYMLLTHKGYTYIYSWNGTFFQGTNSMPHTLSYLMLVVIIFVICVLVETHKKYYTFLAIIPSYCVFISGARVSLVLCMILDCIILSFVFTEKYKNLLIKAIKILPLVAVVLFIFKDKIISSDLMNKIVARNRSNNTSAGRVYMVNNLWNHYIYDSTFLQYLLGQGDDKTYYYNRTNSLVGVEVWAHNDVMQILIGKGFLGIVVYFSSIFLYFKKIIKKSGNIYSFGLITFILVAILLNGFYSYRDIALSIPFIMMVNNELSYKRED